VKDTFIQYADLDDEAALRFCLWWHLAKPDFPDVGCWRVDLGTGTYQAQTGVWFSAAQPLRVGTGGPALPGRMLETRWADGGLDVCDGRCRHFELQHSGEETDVIFDAEGRRAVTGLGQSRFATLDVATGKVVATFEIQKRHAGAEAVAFAGPSLMATDCDDKGNACAWDLYDPASGAHIAAVGGAHPLGAGGSAAMIDAQRFAAVSGTHLVAQDAASGKLLWSIELPRVPRLKASYVIFRTTRSLVLASPDGHILFVDPALGRVTRTLSPPRCSSH
jgi:hypothetical protein